MEEERSLQAGESSHWQGDQTRWRASFGTEEESVASGLQKALQRVTCTGGGYYCPELPSPSYSSAGAGGSWVLAQVSEVRRGQGLAAWTGWSVATEGVLGSSEGPPER